MPDPSIDFSPFRPGFRFNQTSPIVQGMERINTLHPSLHPELLASLQELHIPQDRDIIMFEQWCPLGWEGYFFDLVGTYALANDHQDARRFWLHSPPPGLRQGYTAQDEHTYALDMPPLIAWRRRVIYQAGPLWIEARWDHARGETMWIRGVEEDLLLPSGPQHYKVLAHLKALAPQAYKGIRLLKAMVDGGPGRHEKPEAFDSYEEAVQVIVDVIAVLKTKGQKYRQEDVAAYLLTHTDRFRKASAAQSDDEVESKRRLLRKYCKHEGLSWKDILRLASNP